MNVVLYLRYSSDKQTEQSIEGQDRVCSSYCQANGMTIVARYIDRALSASKHTEKRDEFLRMIRDSEKHTFDAVVVYKLDRFSRDRYDSAIYKNKLKKNGIKVISATEHISDSPEGIILESVLEGMAEFYSKELSQKVSRGMNETALKCNSCGGHIPLGYKIENKKFVVNPSTAPIVVEAFERYAAGETVAEICDAFNNKGYKTAKGSDFNKNSFSNMFANERYIGIYRYKDIRIEGGIPAIIEKELFEEVQRRLKKNACAPSRGKAKVEYLLAQKLFCGHCGSPMTGECGTSRNGDKYNYYTCSKRKRFRSCDKKNVPKEKIEEFVVAKTLELFTPETIDELADIAVNQAKTEARENTIVPAIENELKEIEKSINNLLKLAEHAPESEALVKRLKELEDQKKVTEHRLADEKSKILVLDKPQVVWWLNEFAKGNIHDEHFKRQVLDMLVNSVTVWDEPDGWKVTILYNLLSCVPRTFRCSDLSDAGSPIQYHPNTSARLPDGMRAVSVGYPLMMRTDCVRVTGKKNRGSGSFCFLNRITLSNPCWGATVKKGDKAMVMSVDLRFPDGKAKALTLSYDDGVEQDIRLVEILNAHGLRGTFNLNSGLFSPEGTTWEAGTIHRRMTAAQALALYGHSAHEVAIHGVNHPFLHRLPIAAATAEILEDRKKLEAMFGHIVQGMAYPFGTQVVNDAVVQILRDCGIHYARTTESTGAFDIPTDWLRMPATCHHGDPKLMEYAERFLKIDGKHGPAHMFYLWGHSYEFEQKNDWDVIERFAEYMGGRDDIWYATNGEIYDYVRDWNRMEWSVDCKTVTNPSARTLYVRCGADVIEIGAGETVGTNF